MLKSKEQVQVSNIFPKTKGEHASGLMLIVLKCVASAILPSEILYWVWPAYVLCKKYLYECWIIGPDFSTRNTMGE